MAAEPSTIGLLAAAFDEISLTLKRLKLQGQSPSRYVGMAGEHRVVAVISGVGAGAAEKALRAMVDQDRPRRVIHVGFAGALMPGLAAGTLLAISRVINEAGQGMMVDGGIPQEALAEATSDPQQTLLSLDRIADTTEAKRVLYEQHRAGAADMETFHVTQVARELNLPLTVLRAISDPADMALPAEATQWVRPDGTANIGKVQRYLALRPWQLPMLLKLQRHARLAGQRLAEAVAGEIERAGR